VLHDQRLDAISRTRFVSTQETEMDKRKTK